MKIHWRQPNQLYTIPKNPFQVCQQSSQEQWSCSCEHHFLFKKECYCSSEFGKLYLSCSNFSIRYSDVQEKYFLKYQNKLAKNFVFHAIRWLSCELLTLIKTIQQAGPYMPINLSPQVIVKNLSPWAPLLPQRVLYIYSYTFTGGNQ